MVFFKKIVLSVVPREKSCQLQKKQHKYFTTSTSWKLSKTSYGNFGPKCHFFRSLEQWGRYKQNGFFQCIKSFGMLCTYYKSYHGSAIEALDVSVLYEIIFLNHSVHNWMFAMITILSLKIKKTFVFSFKYDHMQCIDNSSLRLYQTILCKITSYLYRLFSTLSKMCLPSKREKKSEQK